MEPVGGSGLGDEENQKFNCVKLQISVMHHVETLGRQLDMHLGMMFRLEIYVYRSCQYTNSFKVIRLHEISIY